MEKIYFDYAATTPLDPIVYERMKPYFIQQFGNPSSIHYQGQKAESAVEAARGQVASAFNVIPKEIIFTSCGTESNNLAIRGAAFAARAERGANKILISPVEHDAVSITAEQLRNLYGFELDYLPIDEYGRVLVEEIDQKLTSDVAIVSIIFANNEIGTINSIAEIGEICSNKEIVFHTDAMQATGYYHLDLNALNVSLLTFGGHKMYGPKGVGGLFIKQGTPIISTNTGGGQEFGYRAGTHNVPYIVGLAESLILAKENLSEVGNKLKDLRDKITHQILTTIPNSQLTGHPEDRLPNHASFVFEGVDGNTLIMNLDIAGFACSSGSACKTGLPQPSDVLLALGISPEKALGSLRISLGKHNNEHEVDQFLSVLPGIIKNSMAQ